MAIYQRIVKVSSVFLNLICGLIIPLVEFIAYKVRFGKDCDCPSESSSPSSSSGKRHHKGRGRNHHRHQNDVKKIKLLLDITVAQNGHQVLGIQASTPVGGQDNRFEELGKNSRLLGIILRLVNIPSNIMLYLVAKLKQLNHDFQALGKPCCENTRLKKSPKRRITRANYRKIIPFFPFNLLGFSNYSAFQMPSITHTCPSIAHPTAEETNNLNASSISVNSKSRCKRRRNSSSDDTSSSLSDEDISYIEFPEKSITKSNGDVTAGPSSAAPTTRGHDEVDSDETAETVTKHGPSSSSSDNNPADGTHHAGTSKEISVTMNTSTSEDNCGNVTTFTDLDSSGGGPAVVGEERHVGFTFIEELNEAANESYNSELDPEYIPPESEPSSSSGSSFATDKGCSDESWLVETDTVVTTTTNGKDHPESHSESEGKPNPEPVAENPEPGKVASPKTNGASNKSLSSNNVTVTVTAASPADHEHQVSSAAPNSANKKKQNKKQNGAAKNNKGANNQQRKSQNNNPPNKLEPLVTTPSPEEDYKTPEEGDPEGKHPF